MKTVEQVQELIEAPLSPEDLAARYRAICEDPAFARVPGKVEIDLWGRALMSPPAAPYHGRLQSKLSDKLASLGGKKPSPTLHGRAGRLRPALASTTR